ncbi:MAG: hypothetical protein IKG22_15415 [Atopobiaceae bacterium]|nr:hypothetical protein [Atopobiaceae bacterium]
MPRDKEPRRAGNLGGEQHDGQNENQMSRFKLNGSDAGTNDTTDEANEEYADQTGRVYAEADVSKARLVKYPRLREWFKSNPNVFRWFEGGFLELAETANDNEVSGNVLVYHLRFVGIRDLQGQRQKRRVRLSNDLNPVIARTLAILHPDKADKLRMNPCVWDIPALHPLLGELARIAEER